MEEAKQKSPSKSSATESSLSISDLLLDDLVSTTETELGIRLGDEYGSVESHVTVQEMQQQRKNIGNESQARSSIYGTDVGVKRHNDLKATTYTSELGRSERSTASKSSSHFGYGKKQLVLTVVSEIKRFLAHTQRCSNETIGKNEWTHYNLKWIR